MNITSLIVRGISRPIVKRRVVDPLQPVITEQPQDQSVTVGDTATFTVAATVESGTLTYQWEADTGTGFVDIPAETSATLSLPLVALTDNGKLVRARVSANGRSAVSRAALLTVSVSAIETADGFVVETADGFTLEAD